MKKYFLTILFFAAFADVYAQTKMSTEDSLRWENFRREQKGIQQASEADYKTMLKQLHIDSTRPGPSGNPSDVNAANSDESKVPAYTLPDPLVLKNGAKVTDAKTWWRKRELEIVEDFDKEIYGRVPANTPSVKWEVISTTDTTIGDIKAVTKNLLGHVDNSSYPNITVDIQLSLTTPANANKPVPVMMEFSFLFPAGFKLPVSPGPGWQEQILNKGWGYAMLIPTSYQADNGAGLT
ncbi:MAG: hypothetical protein ABI861_02880 [Panacibacter sp.]